jgi:prepilin-type processing-associated H-X9-DG protein
MYPEPNHATGKHGFSLVEALAVIATVGLLAVLLTATFQGAKSQALAAKNIQNHRLITAALIAYAGDHRGDLPFCYDDAVLPKMSYPRLLALEGYVSDPMIFFSPLAGNWQSKDELANLKNPSGNAKIPWFYTNYAANRYGAMPYGWNAGSTDKRHPANLNRVGGDGNLSKLMLLRDCYANSQSERGGGTVWFDYTNYLPPVDRTFGGIVHASFADGHVEAFQHGEIRKLLNNPPDNTAPLFRNLYTKD